MTNGTATAMKRRMRRPQNEPIHERGRQAPTDVRRCRAVGAGSEKVNPEKSPRFFPGCDLASSVSYTSVNLMDVIDRALARNSSDTETGANIETVAQHRDHARWHLANDRGWWLEQTAQAGRGADILAAPRRQRTYPARHTAAAVGAEQGSAGSCLPARSSFRTNHCPRMVRR